MANCLRMRDQNVYLIFQNRAPRGTKVFKRFQSGRKYLLGLPTITTNSFRIPVVQKFENISTRIFSFSFALEFISFLEASTKFMMTKCV